MTIASVPEPRLRPLPIDPHLGSITAALKRSRSLVLVAEPGAGKTTRVPSALLATDMAAAGEIWVLEPRRLAARLAAERVAAELGERLGERVGYQVRFETVAGPQTKIRFVTEGILLRRLAEDPGLTGIAGVVLDEFHERHLATDLALVLIRRLQATLRPELTLLVMSATLDAAAVGRFLAAEVIEVPGRCFPVAIAYREPPAGRLARAETRLGAEVAVALGRLVTDGLDGDVLVFLPGAREIRQTEAACLPLAARHGLRLVPLHGDLSLAEQQRAVRRAEGRKVILATNVAETSITIEGVTVVIDSGLARRARHDPWSGLPSLETGGCSQAQAAQRAGRAGRTQPGRCVRLYSPHELMQRPVHESPEILRSDLAEAVLLLRSSGVRDPMALAWLDAPPRASLEAAERLLERLGAVDCNGTVTPLGARLLVLPVHPRLGRLVCEAASRGAGAAGCLAAALLAERDLVLAARTQLGSERAGQGADNGGWLDTTADSDLTVRMEAFRAALSGGQARAEEARALGLDPGAVREVARTQAQLERAMDPAALRTRLRVEQEEAALGLAVLAAFPDRVARRRTPHGSEVLLAGGVTARMSTGSVVRAADWMVALAAEQQRGQTLVRQASAIAPEWLLELFVDRVEEQRAVCFVGESERVEQVSRLRYDGLVLDESRRTDVIGEDVSRVLAEAALQAGAARFCEPDMLARFLARVAFASANGATLPVLDDVAVAAQLAQLCVGRRSFAELREADLLGGLRAQLSPAQQTLLERLAPDRVVLGSGRRARVEYAPDRPPYVASRLQDFFGMREGPRVAGGQVQVVLHLLAPNQRAVQVTTDLPGFWVRHYPALRRELMRRYPRHAWPEDPFAG